MKRLDPRWKEDKVARPGSSGAEQLEKNVACGISWYL